MEKGSRNSAPFFHSRLTSEAKNTHTIRLSMNQPGVTVCCTQVVTVGIRSRLALNVIPKMRGAREPETSPWPD